MCSSMYLFILYVRESRKPISAHAAVLNQINGIWLYRLNVCLGYNLDALSQVNSWKKAVQPKTYNE